MYRFGHLRQPTIVGPILSAKPKSTTRYFWTDNKPKQQLKQPSPQKKIKKQTSVQPKPYVSPKYTRKHRDNSKKNSNDQMGNENHGVNGEEIEHRPYVIYPGDTNAIRLPDGRLMGFAMYGRPDPKREMIPLVVEHGTPGTRLSCYELQDWGHRSFVPIIAPERPGMGISTCVDGYSVADHARDVMFLVGSIPHQQMAFVYRLLICFFFLQMRALGYRKYRVCGVGEGGPYALGITALARKSEVLVCGIMAGRAPVEASQRNLSPLRIWRSLVTFVLPQWRALQMESTRSIQLSAQSKVFRAIIDRERKYLETNERFTRDAVKGYRLDQNAIFRAWEFNLESIRDKKIPVHMVYGDKDTNAPLSGGLYLKGRIGPNCTLTVIPDTNHYTSQHVGAWLLLKKVCEYK